MITSTLYFVGNIEIPNIETVNVPNASRVGKNGKLNDFINEYELDALSKSLSFSLYDSFSSELEVKTGQTVQTIKDSADQKWKDLFNGKTYELNGSTVRYRGLVYTENGIPKSPLAYYVFSKFLENDMSHYGGIGLQIEEAKNSRRASYAPKFVLASQKFYELIVGNYEDPKKTSGYRSMCQFISDMNDIDNTIYQNWNPYTFPKVNIMGI